MEEGWVVPRHTRERENAGQGEHETHRQRRVNHKKHRRVYKFPFNETRRQGVLFPPFILFPTGVLDTRRQGLFPFFPHGGSRTTTYQVQLQWDRASKGASTGQAVRPPGGGRLPPQVAGRDEPIPTGGYWP